MNKFQQLGAIGGCNNDTLMDKYCLQQYHDSTQIASNYVSHILLDNTWKQNAKHEDKILDQIYQGSQTTLQNIDNKSTWKSNLSDYRDAENIFAKALSKCSKCETHTTLVGVDQLRATECKCDMGTSDSANSCDKNIFAKQYNLKVSPEGRCSEEKLIKTKAKPRQSRNQLVISNSPPVVILDDDKVEDEDKAHKSNVAKITFKTAKEQLMASNPAAKRSLGASRKAQAKFISPMIGAQDKQDAVENEITDERLKHIDPKMIELIESEIIDRGNPIGWEDIAGLELAKSVIQEAVVWPLLRPDMFTGLRRPPRGILLFGPPGTGKTLIGKCIASQCRATFFSISASSLTSKWIGDGEKMVRALFAVAACHQPSVIFIDEIDSLLTQRNDSEHEATRRIKTEFLVQFDGAATGDDERLLVVGATNRPHSLDEAARRRLVKRLYVPLPETQARQQIISNLLRTEINELTPEQVLEIAERTAGYSGADMKSLCSEAAMGPVRSVPLSQIATIDRNMVRPVNVQDFINALQRVRPSVSQDDLGQYVKWNNTYGQGF